MSTVQGAGPPGRAGRTTIFDVAREAGVSYSTVSRVVNGQPHVSAATRERVQEVMRRLGYSADLRARSLAGGRTRILGLVLRDIMSGFMAEVVRAVDAEVASSGYDLMLCTTHARASSPDEYIGRLVPGLVDGLLVLVTREPGEWLGRLQRAGFPHVLLDDQGPFRGSSVVRAGNREGVDEVVDHLASLGHRDVAMVAGDAGQDTTRIRREIFLARTAVRGLRTRVVPGGYQEADGYAAGSALLASPERPTAVVACNDSAAFGVMRAARELGVDVPADLSVVGFDDVLEARLTLPRLTTVRQPIADIGQAATALLVDHIEHPDRAPRAVELPTSLVVRDSTAGPPGR